VAGEGFHKMSTAHEEIGASFLPKATSMYDRYVWEVLMNF
jgi:hypothetical protein